MSFWDYYVADWLSYLAGVASLWLAYGIGFGALLWMIGQCVRLIYQLVRY